MAGMKLRAALLAATGCAALAAANGGAQAGSFGVRDQSAIGAGDAYAGAAAGADGLSSMFWNAATMTDRGGIQFSTNTTPIFPYGSATSVPSATSPMTLGPLSAFYSQSTGNIGVSAVAPSMSASYQINDRLWAGMTINAPFGLGTEAPHAFAGSFYGVDTSVFSIDLNPSVAFKVNDMFSVSAGLQAMYFKTHASQNLPNFAPAPASLIPPFDLADLYGTGWGYGFTLGATIKPFAGTEIGLGFRSPVDMPIDGALNVYGGAGTIGATSATTGLLAGSSIPAKLTFHLPAKFTIGVSQRITDRFTLLASYEFDDWSRMGNPAVTAKSGFAVITPLGPALAPAGTNLNTFQLHYKDGHFFALGGEYALNDKVTLRAGASYEVSPIDDSNRQFTLPDGDRIGLSAGFSYKVNDTVKLNAGYEHLFVRGGTATYAPPNYPIPFQANAKGAIDIVSVGLDVSLGAPPPAAPVKASF